MNLFCFTLDGSSESIYEPACSHTLKEELPRSQCSPVLRRKWAGSDPSLNCERLQTTVKLKRNFRRSCVPTSSLDDETLGGDVHHACWSSCGERKDSAQEKTEQSREQYKAPCPETRDDRGKEATSGRTQPDRLAQVGESSADTAESVLTTRLKKLHNLVQAKKGHHSDTNNVVGNNSSVLSCIGLSKRAEKKFSKTSRSLQQQQQVIDVHEDSEEEGVWSTMDRPQPGSPFYHTCHQPGHELWVYGSSFSLPWTTEWHRFESLIQELDSKQSDPCPPQMIRSTTDLHLAQNTLTRFGAFRQATPLMTPRDDGTPLLERNRGPTELRLRDDQRDRRHVQTTPEETQTAITIGEIQKEEAEIKEVGVGWPLTKGHKLSSNSLESLYSLRSGQSSSSGVTSGSDFSSNRGSLRLDQDLLYTRRFCGRARVHTDFVPSPYDTESLKLQVGDVIDIITKSPMGTWTGMLNNRIGTFKFIYVDVLTEAGPETMPSLGVRHKCRSTVHEVLRRLSLEEYSSSLQLNGYQTVDDLMMLKEHHLTELNVTDPEHRHRLLTAVQTLQQLCSNCHLEDADNREVETPDENTKADMNNCPRDSGCHMPADSPVNGGEDTDLHFLCDHPPPAETTAS